MMCFRKHHFYRFVFSEAKFWLMIVESLRLMDGEHVRSTGGTKNWVESVETSTIFRKLCGCAALDLEQNV
jgi:hypothetical protein